MVMIKEKKNCASTYISNGRLPQIGLQNGLSRLLIRQRDVNQLVQTTRTQDGRIDNVYNKRGRDCFKCSVT